MTLEISDGKKNYLNNQYKTDHCFPVMANIEFIFTNKVLIIMGIVTIAKIVILLLWI